MPRDTLTRERIVRTAIELLDAEGLEGLNMRGLGERLESAATAVYWHVKSKDNLVMLAGDEVWHEIELPDLDAHDWRTAGMMAARGLFGMLTRHPWLVQALGTHLLQGPGKSRYDEYSLAVYEKAGFVGVEADRAMAVVFMFVLGNAIGESAAVSLRRRLRREGSNPDDLIRQTMADQIKIVEEFPRLQARLATVTDTDYLAAPDKSFELGLEVIFDGLEERLGRRQAEGGEGVAQET
ncbi:TetR/AcrR family transcriptional regulator C-terminal domain-containing protein [Thermopolyspora sp. NPDC052614]|uniref:TetR/AcrR family transcriptional regulator n=1 Tax=Thermopolyspora sp. NPDC052614 TaxID=3155682 RepID=UPI003433423C